MGEIGIPRDQFLYALEWWEINSIIRGYRRRDRLKHQLMAECAYAAMFAMRDPKGKTVRDIFPSIFQDDDPDDPDTPTISSSEVEHLRALMREENARLQSKQHA